MRICDFGILIGTNGTGKSTNMLKLLPINKRNLVLPANELDKAWRRFPRLHVMHQFEDDPTKPGKTQRKRFHFYTLGPGSKKTWGLNHFNDTRVLTIPEEYSDEDCRDIFKALCLTRGGFSRGGLFVDDFKNYIYTKGTLPSYVRKLFGDRRHRMLDIYLATHSLQEINADMMQFQPRIWLGRTTLPPNETVIKKMPNGNAILAAYTRVMKVTQKNMHYFEEIPAISTNLLY